MRVHLAAIIVAVVVPVFAQPVIPQEEPLPPVTSSAVLLANAARANDFTTFDALYRAKPVEAFRPLHELWTYSVSDAGGAFYGAGMYERFARAYPSFAETIAPHRIVDSHGNAFYPSRETRTFLLAQAERGAVAAAPRKVAPVVPVAVTEAPVKAKIAVAAPPPAPPAIETPSEAPLPVVTTAAPPVVRTQPVTAAVAAPAKPAKEDHASGRGLLLLIIGLIGTGVLALIVRAPREVPSIRNH